MKPLKWREPWALSRRRFAREVFRIIVRSRLPWLYLITACVGLEVTRQLSLYISPTYPFPLARTALGLTALPIGLCLQCSLLMIFPSYVELKHKWLHANQGNINLWIRPEKLLRWKVQERGGYRRIVLRYISQKKKEQHRSYWLSSSVDRADLENRMRAFMDRGERERARRGEALPASPRA